MFFPSHIRLNGLDFDLFAYPGVKKGDTLTIGRRYLGGGRHRDLEWQVLDVLFLMFLMFRRLKGFPPEKPPPEAP